MLPHFINEKKVIISKSYITDINLHKYNVLTFILNDKKGGNSHSHQTLTIHS